MPAKKMGRPLSDNPKNLFLKVRVDAVIIEKMDACRQKLNMTRSDVVRKGIEKIFEALPR